MNFSSDLSTLSTLTESTLLCSIEQRCRGELTESYVGGVLLSFGPSNKTTGSQFLPSFASSVLRSLAFSHEDQSILISGYHGSDKRALSYDLLGALLSHVEQRHQTLSSSVLLVNELLGYFCYSDENEPTCGGAVVVTTLHIEPTTLILAAANVCCLLLDTNLVSHYKVFQNPNGFNYVKSCLIKLGMEVGELQQVFLVLSAIQNLLTGARTAQTLSNIGVTKLPDNLPAEDSLVQLLYAYLVQWIVCWANSNCLGAGRQRGSSLVSVACAPGHCFSPEESSTLSALIIRYANEVLHNIYCNRLFVWEQEQYLEEGIEWDEVEVEFNESLMNCFHQEDGNLLQVLGLPDRDAMRAGVERCCRVSGDSCFILNDDKDRFALAHFTGEYEYAIDEKWIGTDQMQVVGDILQASFRTCSCDLVVGMAQNMCHSADVLPHSQKLPACALTQRAKQAMDSVCELLTTSQPHFVFCFKLSKNGRRNFNCDFVLSQLQQFKILDIALIQSCGFPVRLHHSNFLKNYGALFVDSTQVLSDQEKCVVILESSRLKEWHVGLTMVMLKPWHLSQLDSTLDLFNQSAKKLQRVFKQSIHRKRQSLPTSSLLDTARAPSPPPRPTHTLPTQTVEPQPVAALPPSPRAGEYDRASSPHSTSPHKKKRSWKQPSKTGKSSASSSTNLETFVWFQGKLSREKAEERLQRVRFDCFLIRESESRVGEYALSLRQDSSIKHFRIDTKQGLNSRYELYGAKRSFPSLEVLVDYYSHHCISSGGELLKTPYSIEKQEPPTPIKRKLSSIRRPKPSLTTASEKERILPRTKTTPSLDSPRAKLPPKELSLDISDDSIAMLQRELEVEERIVEAARRMAELPSSNRRERQKRKQSLQQAQSQFLSLKQQFHTLKERKRFIESSMRNANQ